FVMFGGYRFEPHLFVAYRLTNGGCEGSFRAYLQAALPRIQARTPDGDPLVGEFRSTRGRTRPLHLTPPAHRVPRLTPPPTGRAGELGCSAAEETHVGVGCSHECERFPSASPRRECDASGHP